MATRRYEQKRRAEQQSETRRRIVEAVVALHEEIGPAQTTIKAIAERAGVERLTVYRHFGDESALFSACAAHFLEMKPLPDPAAWSDIADPEERLRTALLAFYAYYGRGEDMIANARRDAAQLPALAATLAPWAELYETVREDLLATWSVRGRARTRLAAAIGHAISFDTWRSLVRGEGLEDVEAVELMVGLVRAAAAAR